MKFVVSIFFRSIHSDGSSEIWEEKLVYIESDSESSAIEYAKKWSKDEEVEYEVENGSLKWEFYQIERAHLLEDETLNTGTELFSRFLKETEALSILQKINDD